MGKVTNVVKASRSPEFARPPINEIVMGVAFHRPPSLTIAHLGLFWKRVKDEFPQAEEHTPIGDVGTFPLADGLPLPRIWLVEERENKLLQLQVDRFYLNWRRRDNSDVYPRFAALCNLFAKHWRMFREFIGEFEKQPLVLSGAELTKISHLPEGSGWNKVSDIGSVLAPVSWPTIEGDPAPRHFACRMGFEFPDAQVSADLKSARLRDVERGVFTLEIRSTLSSVKGVAAEQAEVMDKFAKANELVNLVFTSIVTPELQRAWGRTK